MLEKFEVSHIITKDEVNYVKLVERGCFVEIERKNVNENEAKREQAIC